MASLLRQIVAGPRAKHAETGLDLCYVTDNIIVTSGPSQTYPQRAYRNPLDHLVAFLDAKHGDNWSIWEFRAEGTGYPDEAVYGRVWHYPWPDHHPPPFRLVPMIMASMRNWLEGEDSPASGRKIGEVDEAEGSGATGKEVGKTDSKNKRVVVVHCKAGKGRSGTVTCSYLISQCGWKAEDALARFTERRMRPKFGTGVSIPSQLRWISYVDRWTKAGKKYVDREIEICEIHVWGLRHGVKVTVEGFADEGKKIKVLHTFKKEERCVVQGDAPGGGGMMDFLGDALSPPVDDEEIYEDADYKEIVGGGEGTKGSDTDGSRSGTSSPATSQSKKGSRMSLLSGKLSRNTSVKRLNANPKSKTINPDDFSSTSAASSANNLSAPVHNASQPSLSTSATMADTNEPGGMAVILKPSAPVRIPNSDVCISLERRNRAPASMGFTMVTAVAHVWFNAFFEGRGPEQDGEADESGVFEIEWDKMDGLKGSSRKGTRAADRISVVWRAVGTPGPVPVINEPGEGSPVPQMRPADWKGVTDDDPDASRVLGLRTEAPGSENVSKASSIRSQEVETEKVSDDESLKGVKTSNATGGELHHTDISEHEKKVEATKGRTENPDEASGSSVSEEKLLEAATAPCRAAKAGSPSETAIKQKEAEEEAERAGQSETDKEVEGQHEKHHEGGEHEHGFVKVGKKLLPTHHKKTEDDAKDPRLMSVSVQK
ncbi:Phosphatidylinositol 3,4,5-trisphosphate 3-phosphatase and dual-specificity protein phosphatase PTEN [Cytospora mali]|uniref:phosphatidylinositol-3,4,5-trisphosphate 3-phosphatase n=1 Tax=Cytospora mali TaxID=578113 RepID=A0A194VXN1_CYTMA|nr:Phosphatidylinositol 3,4,5-trisphosphate 3-phosphatase and dual-specificity protein phosphatase PTEN [Valsa mali]